MRKRRENQWDMILLLKDNDSSILHNITDILNTSFLGDITDY